MNLTELIGFQSVAGNTRQDLLLAPKKGCGPGAWPPPPAWKRGSHLAHTAGLAQGAHGPHVALVPGAEFRGVVVGSGVQAVTDRHLTHSLQVALATREEKRERPSVNTREEGEHPARCLRLPCPNTLRDSSRVGAALEEQGGHLPSCLGT